MSGAFVNDENRRLAMTLHSVKPPAAATQAVSAKRALRRRPAATGRTTKPSGPVRRTATTLLLLAVLALTGCSSAGESNPNYLHARVSARCPPAIVSVGDRVTIKAKIRNLSNVDWPNTDVFIGGNDGWNLQVAADDAGTTSTSSNSLGDFQMRGIRPHDSMTLTATYVPTKPGNFDNIEIAAWGSGDTDNGVAATTAHDNCSVTVNP